MLQTLRARLIVICVGITLASLLVLSATTFFTVRKDTLASVDARIGQLTQIYATQVGSWVREKQRITSSMHIAAASTGELTISFVEPAGPQGNRIGAFGTEMRLASIAKTVAAIRPVASSFVFLVDAEGLLIAHPEAERVLKPVSSVSPTLNLAQLQALTQQLRRIDFVRNALQDIASGDGDLTRRLDATGHDELAQIAQGFNHFADKIAAVLLRIREASESVRLAMSEIATGSQDLSGRTEGQASSLEETVAAMEELTATVQQNAALVEQATAAAQSLQQQAHELAEVVAAFRLPQGAAAQKLLA